MLLYDLSGESHKECGSSVAALGGQREMLMENKDVADAMFDVRTLPSSFINSSQSVLTELEC